MCNYGAAYNFLVSEINWAHKKTGGKNWKNKLSLFVWNNAFTIKSNCIKHSWNCNSTLMLKLIKSNYNILPYNFFLLQILFWLITVWHAFQD